MDIKTKYKIGDKVYILAIERSNRHEPKTPSQYRLTPCIITAVYFDSGIKYDVNIINQCCKFLSEGDLHTLQEALRIITENEVDNLI